MIRALQITIIAALIFLTGGSSCLSLWVMLFLMRAPPKVAAQQFCTTVEWGIQYRQTSSRDLGASLLITVFLVPRLKDSTKGQEWETWAAALAILIPVAPYEIYVIFPINETIDEIRLELKGKKAEDFRPRKRQSWESC